MFANSDTRKTLKNNRDKFPRNIQVTAHLSNCIPKKSIIPMYPFAFLKAYQSTKITKKSLSYAKVNNDRIIR